MDQGHREEQIREEEEEEAGSTLPKRKCTAEFLFVFTLKVPPLLHVLLLTFCYPFVDEEGTAETLLKTTDENTTDKRSTHSLPPPPPKATTTTIP